MLDELVRKRWRLEVKRSANIKCDALAEASHGGEAVALEIARVVGVDGRAGCFVVQLDGCLHLVAALAARPARAIAVFLALLEQHLVVKAQPAVAFRSGDRHETFTRRSRLLLFEQLPLAVEAPAVAREFAVAADGPMAGDDDRRRVGRAGPPDGPRALRLA